MEGAVLQILAAGLFLHLFILYRKGNGMVKVVLDVMGGDYAPQEILQGGLDALEKEPGIHLFAVGKEDTIHGLLSGREYPRDRLTVVGAGEVIETSEPPVAAIRNKKDSSIVVGLQLLKTKEADAFVSAGSTGAVLVKGQFIVGRSKRVERAPLAPLIPTEKGFSLLIDCGANVDARASHLVQFAKMGSVYMKELLKIENPRVAIVNVGAEEEKGNALVKETFPLLKACRDINFIGSIEAREIPRGGADVIVCEAFTGNVILKLYEGLGDTLMRKIKDGLMSSFMSKVGALLIKSALKKTLKDFDAGEYGGASLLGLKGIVVKTHGNAKRKEISNSILQCFRYKESGVDRLIGEVLTGEDIKEEKQK